MVFVEEPVKLIFHCEKNNKPKTLVAGGLEAITRFCRL